MSGGRSYELAVRVSATFRVEAENDVDAMRKAAEMAGHAIVVLSPGENGIDEVSFSNAVEHASLWADDELPLTLVSTIFDRG